MTTATRTLRRRRRAPGLPILSPIGRWIATLLEFLGGLVQLFGASAAGLYHIIADCRMGPVERRVAVMDFLETVRQMRLVSWGALGIAVVTVSSSGMVLAMETVNQLRAFGMAQAFLGGGVAYATMREMAPVLTAVVATASVGSSITAQLGSMQVSEQVDAIRSMGVNPIRYLVIPRFAAMSIMIPVLTVIADYCGLVGGFLIARLHQIALSTYLHSIEQIISLHDFAGGILKAFVFGVLISLTACLIGLRTTGGAAGVGRSTILSVVTCIVLIYVWDTLLTAVIWNG
jgi:phospholipid/cholesterol/gamma-HCH transport system permease protein